MEKYYVYAHVNDIHGTFYIGKGSGKRLFTTGNRSVFWKRIVSKYGYTASIVEECSSEEYAYEREVFWIKYYKTIGQCSANLTLGGDGVRVDKRWWGKKIGASLKGIIRPAGKESKIYKDAIDHDNLKNLYLIQKMSVTDIGCAIGVSSTTVWERLREFGIPIRGTSHYKKQVICITDGRVFRSISDAAKVCGVYRENIRKVLSGKYRTTGGLMFAYKENCDE